MNSNNTDKYSTKIANFIRSELESLIHDEVSDTHKTSLPPSEIDNYSVLKLISKSIDSAKPDNKLGNRTYNIQQTAKLRATHSRDQAPLMYLFFSMIYTEGLIDQISLNTPDLTDFWQFYSWYREVSHSIDYSKIDRVISSLDPGAEGNGLVEMYRLLYRTSGPRSILHQNIYRNRFVSLDIQHDLESTDLMYQEILIDTNKIHIFHPICADDSTDSAPDNAPDNASKNAPAKDVSHSAPNMKLITHIIRALNIMASQSKSYLGSPSKSLELTIIMSSQKKMNSDDKLLSTDSINSGSTYPGKTILVWRSEELYKVLIHELIHFHGLDFGMNHPLYSKLEEKMENIIKYDGYDAINETYTECLAILINSIFYGYYNHNKTGDTGGTDNTNDLISESLRYEKIFNMWQVAKICRLYGGHDIRDLLENKIEIVQTTSVRSYYVYKMFVLYDLNAFLKFVEDSKCGLSICDRLLEFGDLLVKSYDRIKKDVSYTDTLNKFIELIDNKEKAIAESNDPDSGRLPWMYKTGRMSAISIE